VRRVVTGVAASGESVFVSDGPAEVLGADLAPPGVELIWGSDEPPMLPTDGSKPDYLRYFPPADGYRIIVVPIPPDSAGGATDMDLMSTLDEEFVGLISDAEWDPDVPGMHRTRTIDIGLVLEGRVLLELDEGESRELGPGDWYVQNGTRHVWRNPWAEPCKLVIFFVGATER
jgi:mannose-6-phosphate isomerase-like protein (cupin superfamily)